jgi:DNA invertase Pin-like site-specific DNA recombinase
MRETKITADHLKRDAYLYVRQSSPRQVIEHSESTQRQYALRNRAVAAGWPVDRIRVVDCDLGKSASIATAVRDGFQQLVSDVALGKAGVVMGLEASRLARKSSEWHRLIELCGMTATLLADEDGFYDPADFNDRLVLGLKGTMSEAESHIIKARMRGGQLNKARRGELEMGPPVGLVYRNDGTICLDPDVEVQQALQLVFDTFERTGSAMETVRHFLQQGLLFPRRLRIGPNKGDLLWAPPRHQRILQVLHNPRYAGAFVYGRTRTRHMPDGSTKVIKVARADWQHVMPGMHPGYINWERFESNQRRLAENAHAFGGERRSGPPREGPALLQGRVLCGLCGERMGVHYHQEHGCIVPIYICQETSVRSGGKVCQRMPGKAVDAAVANLILEMMMPMTLAVTLDVQRELETRAAETDGLRRKHVERLRYDAELARRRYMKVDPENRLVADSLEAEWNDKLRRHADAAEEYERLSRKQAETLNAETRRRILNLAEQLPQIWKNERIDIRERKRIVRLLIEDVTLIRGESIIAHVRLSGGATRTLSIERSLPIAKIRKVKPEIVAKVDSLIDHHCDREIAEILNQHGWKTWEGKPFDLKKVAFIRSAYKLSSRRERMREHGMLTTSEVAEKLGVGETTVHKWGVQGLIKKCYSDRLRRGLWDIPPGLTIIKGQGGRRPRPARLECITAQHSE